MPTYEFECPKCGMVTSAVSSIAEVANLEAKCPYCRVAMKRKFGLVGVSWKCSRPTPYSRVDKDKKMSDIPDD